MERIAAPLSNAQAVRDHLAEVAASPEFITSPRLVSFLRFVVETTLQGHRDSIKESLIAVEVYGRKPDYNPQTDSTVRVEASRLRQRLAQFYSARPEQSVRIELPKGSYAPTFHCSPPSAVPFTTRRTPMRLVPGAAACVLVFAIAVLFWPRTAESDTTRPRNIAVLPIVPLGGTSADVAQGMTEELMTALTQRGGLSVMLQQSPQTNNVLQGSVRKLGTSVVVTARLIDTRTGHHLWADRVQAPEADLGHLAEQLAASVAGDLTAKPHVEQDMPVNVSATYHRALDLLRIPVMKDGMPHALPSNVPQAVQLFREVTRSAPKSARAWAGLAEAAEWEYELRGNTPSSLLDEARAAARRAVELDSGLVDGWSVLTSILFYRDMNLQSAEEACRRAIELDPRNASARQRLIDILRIRGRREEATIEVDSALRLQPTSAPYLIRRALLQMEDRRWNEAYATAFHASTLTNHAAVYPFTLWIQGMCREEQGKLQDAERLYRTAMDRQPHDIWSEPALGRLYARTGRMREAEAVLDELRAQSQRGRMRSIAQAIVLEAMGRSKEAALAVQQAWSRRDDSVLYLPVESRLRSLSNTPEVRQVLAHLRPR